MQRPCMQTSSCNPGCNPIFCAHLCITLIQHPLLTAALVCSTPLQWGPAVFSRYRLQHPTTTSYSALYPAAAAQRSQLQYEGTTPYLVQQYMPATWHPGPIQHPDAEHHGCTPRSAQQPLQDAGISTAEPITRCHVHKRWQCSTQTVQCPGRSTQSAVPRAFPVPVQSPAAVHGCTDPSPQSAPQAPPCIPESDTAHVVAPVQYFSSTDPSDPPPPTHTILRPATGHCLHPHGPIPPTLPAPVRFKQTASTSQIGCSAPTATLSRSEACRRSMTQFRATRRCH
jgi:hypothetical protein